MAMTKEQLQERINKSQVKIEKLEKKVEKYSKLVSQEFKNIVKEVISTNKVDILREYNLRNYNDRYCCGYESDYYNAKTDLRDAQRTYSNYLTKIKEIKQFESEEKIEVIWNFLTEWETKAYEWYIQNANLYIELHDKYDEAWEESKEEYKYVATYKSWEGNVITRIKYNEIRFKENYYFNIQSLTRQITNVYCKTIDTEKLAKTIKDEKERKYKDLVNRVAEVVGSIQDASNLSIGNQSGELNGIIKGSNGTCKIETISAGGYNIQCFHYKVLVNKLR